MELEIIDRIDLKMNDFDKSIDTKMASFIQSIKDTST